MPEDAYGYWLSLMPMPDANIHAVRGKANCSSSARLQMRPDVLPHEFVEMFHAVFHRRLVRASVIFSP